TYLQNLGMQVHEIAVDEAGQTPLARVRERLSPRMACVVVQSPNFFGVIEDFTGFAEAVDDEKALVVQAVAEPVSLGLLKPPGAWGADIVVGEGQSFGNALSYGGRYLRFFAQKRAFCGDGRGRRVAVMGGTE